VRTSGSIGSSLQADVALSVNAADHALLPALGDDLKFVLITSHATLTQGDAMTVTVTPSTATKCERCWHWRSDVGHDTEHPALCGRCTSNLYGAGEARRIA